MTYISCANTQRNDQSDIGRLPVILDVIYVPDMIALFISLTLALPINGNNPKLDNSPPTSMNLPLYR